MSASRRLAVLIPGVAIAGALLLAPGSASALDLFKAVGTVVEHQDAIIKSGQALRKGFAELTPQEE